MVKRGSIGSVTLLGLLLLATSAFAGLEVDVSCPDTAKRDTEVSATIKLTNTGESKTITRGAFAMHLGNLSLVGPIAFAVSQSLAPNASVSVGPIPVFIPTQARSGLFVSVIFGLLGQNGASPTRELLGDGQCLIEIVP